MKNKYFDHTEQDIEDDIFNCVNCNKRFKMKYDENNKPISMWCDNCRLKREFKMKDSQINTKSNEDPYVSLAQMKVLLDRTKTYWKGKAGSNQYNAQASDIILADINKILSKAKIPAKYLIAESLD